MEPSTTFFLVHLRPGRENLRGKRCKNGEYDIITYDDGGEKGRVNLQTKKAELALICSRSDKAYEVCEKFSSLASDIVTIRIADKKKLLGKVQICTEESLIIN